MGYTHYWTVSAEAPIKDYRAAMRDIFKLIKNSPVILGDGFGDTVPKKFHKGFVWFNGLGENAHETFHLPDFPPKGFQFCKTARKPYDLVVTACLAVLKEHLGNAVDVSSDGYAKEWLPGIEFASKVLGREVPNPIEE